MCAHTANATTYARALALALSQRLLQWIFKALHIVASLWFFWPHFQQLSPCSLHHTCTHTPSATKAPDSPPVPYDTLPPQGLCTCCGLHRSPSLPSHRISIIFVAMPAPTSPFKIVPSFLPALYFLVAFTTVWHTASNLYSPHPMHILTRRCKLMKARDFCLYICFSNA